MYRYIKSFSLRVNKKKIFSTFTTKWLKQSKPCNELSIPQDIDTYIIGSDQLWGLHCTGGVKDSVYFGDFKRRDSSKVIGYAISAEQKSIDDFCSEELKKDVFNFTTLSFRESLISDVVSKKSGVASRVDIDPTLLTDASTWDAMINKKWAKEKYVLLYQVRTLKDDYTLLNRKANELASQLNCKVIDLSDMNYSVEDFVSLFKYAQCVITSSFHASVFSVIFERPLQAVMLKDGHDGRYENILRAIGMDSVLVDKKFTPLIVNSVYKDVIAKLYDLKNVSKSYLNNI